MDPTVTEECAPSDPPSTPAPSYDDAFPALPESNNTGAPTNNTVGQRNKMRISTSSITTVFRVPVEERRDASDKFGEGESNHNCLHIMKETGTNIEISSSKDQSLTFLVQGKPNNVTEARRKILQQFQTQARVQIHIPQDHHRLILGKAGQRLKDLEKTTATKINIPRQSEVSDIITITGPKEGIDKAVHEISIISDEHSRQANERVEIPKIYHPFITGANNEKVTTLMEETGVRIHVPPLSVMKDEITIAGEKQGVLLAKERILNVYEDMKKKCTTVSIQVPKPQHKYIIGQRGAAINEILSSTGVSVEMPSTDSSASSITIRGPQDKIGAALTMVYEKANSVGTETIDAPSWLHKYIIGRKGSKIRELTQDMPKVHVEFADGGKIKIEGPPEEVSKVAELLRSYVNDLINTMSAIEMSVDIKFHKHIIGKAGSNINKLKEETGVTISISEKDFVIRIDGNKEGVQRAKQVIADMVNKLENEKEEEIQIDQRFFRSLIGTKGENIKELRDKFNQVQIMFPGIGEPNKSVKIRGPKNDVAECSKCLSKMVKDLKEILYRDEVKIYKQFHKHVIGKAGANIRKIRDETQTQIDLPGESDISDAIVITGKKENVEQAKGRIQKIQDELMNTVDDEVIIPSKFHNTLIGPGGKLIHSIIEECGGVSINIPPAESNNDKVLIRGPKEDVEKAKRLLLELSNERQLSSFHAEVRAKPQHHKYLIGKNGVNIKRIRDSTGARIVFPSEKDKDKEVITIMGKKEAVEAAKAELESRIEGVANTTEGSMTVDPKHHRHFTTRRGEVLRRIIEECGGVNISFPRSGDSSDRVALIGAKECIEATKARISEIVNDLEAQVTIECVIPQRHHRTLRGQRNSKIQNVEAQHRVQIKFPDRDNVEEYMPSDEPNTDDTAVRRCDVIQIIGKSENCEGAKQALLDLVPITIEVPVPFEFHRTIIGQKGRDVKELAIKYDVNIVLSPPDQRLDVIKIIGAQTCVEAAKEAVEQRCKEIEADQADRVLRSFEVKIEVDPEYHHKIIGPKGAVINKIRADHAVQIILPKKEDPSDNVITIVGYEKDANSARDAIRKMVNELNDLAKEELDVDSRVHSRLIGSKGRNIRKIMEQYSVEIKFARPIDPNPNTVTVWGQEDNVQDCKAHLLNLVEEYMQDVEDEDYRNSFMKMPNAQPASAKDPNDPGFVVKGGPWEQKAPNMESKEEFPSFGGAAAVTVPVSGGGWGPNRKWGADSMFTPLNYQ